MKNLFQISLVTLITSLCSNNLALAQLIPDQTLGNENSLVNSTNNLLQIEGGATRGQNLFHSFREFNINTNQEVFFNNAPNIESIFTRVTGGNISNIDGLIRNVGQADLFILNPAGIVFGENAQLNIGGSFFATTAESIFFADNSKFGVNDLDNKPLLTVTAPVGLGLNNPGKIVNRGVLSVNPNQNITLVGGDIELDGTSLNEENFDRNLTASGGTIQLGGLAKEGNIQIEPNGNLVFPNNTVLSDISLMNRGSINVFGNGGGDIIITGQNVTLTDGSALFAGINNSGDSVDGQAGDIIVNGIDRVVFDGVSKTDSSNATIALNQVFQQGKAGNIEINTKQLDITNGARLLNLTFGLGDTGNIIINAEENVNIDGSGSAIFNTILPNAKGNAGNIEINTKSLSLTNGGQITENIFNGEGNLGNVIINAKENVNIDGSASAIFNTIFPGKGEGGDILINTKFLTLTNGARISANLGGEGNLGNIIINATETVSIDGKTSNPQPNNFPESAIFNTLNDNGLGNGGTIEINTENLSLTNEGRLFTSTIGTGNAGNVTINAQNQVNIDSGSIISEVGVNNFTGRIGEGNGGTIEINTEKLTLRNQGSLSVSSKGKGNIGQILINTNSLEIKNNSSIEAETSFRDSNNSLENSTKNNIVININGNLTLEENSQISARATEEANGGNVAINADFIISFPENNDIIASASAGEGGNISITTNGIFGIESRGEVTPFSDITASSDIGLDGDVSIKILEINPGETLTQLPTEIVDKSNLIAKGCLPSSAEEEINKFIVTGKGGLPINPNDSLRDNTVLSAEWLTLPQESQKTQDYNKVGNVRPKEIVEAKGWIVGANGNVILTSSASSKANKYIPWLISHSCQ